MEVDGASPDEARRAAGLRTDEETLEEASRLLVRMQERTETLGPAAEVRWEGDRRLDGSGACDAATVLSDHSQTETGSLP